MPTRYRARMLDNVEALATHYTPGRTIADMNADLGADLLVARPGTETDEHPAVMYAADLAAGELHPGLWFAAFDDGSTVVCDDVSFRAMFTPVEDAPEAAAA